MAKAKQWAIFYVIIAIILSVLGLSRKEPIYLWASVVIALLSFYWIWKAWKKV